MAKLDNINTKGILHANRIIKAYKEGSLIKMEDKNPYDDVFSWVLFTCFNAGCMGALKIAKDIFYHYERGHNGENDIYPDTLTIQKQAYWHGVLAGIECGNPRQLTKINTEAELNHIENCKIFLRNYVGKIFMGVTINSRIRNTNVVSLYIISDKYIPTLKRRLEPRLNTDEYPEKLQYYISIYGKYMTGRMSVAKVASAIMNNELTLHDSVN